MPRASETQKAERLNRARDLLLHVDQLSDAVGQLAQDCSISPRQAYRYLEQAQRLKEPLPPSEAKLAFTVKLPHSLVRRVRTFAAAKGLSISEVVSRALLALLPRGRGRGVSRNQFGNIPCSWNIDSTVCCQTNSRACISGSCQIYASQSEVILRNKQIQRQE
jgi:predicted HicB family RNase H-like nuclease